MLKFRVTVTQISSPISIAFCDRIQDRIGERNSLKIFSYGMYEIDSPGQRRERCSKE